MGELRYRDRRNTNCNKWDGQTKMFGEEGLHAMWVADMDFEAPDSVKKALAKYVEEGVYGYYQIPDSYYDAFINWEKKRHGVDVKQEWLRFSPGVVAAFNWIIRFQTSPEASVLVKTPVYYPFLDAVKNNGRKLICSDLVNEDGRYHIDFQDFEQKIVDNKVELFILCSPHNPAGRVWKREELEELLKICRKHHVFVIADEIHQDLVLTGHKHISMLTIDGYDDMVITIKAPSKTFNLAGCQNSIVVIPDEKLREKWDAYVLGLRVLSGNAFGYIAAEAAYRDGEGWLTEVLETIEENYHYVADTLKEHCPEITVTPLEGTYLCWIDLGAYVAAEDMKEFMQAKCRLAVDYGSWFGGERFGQFIRMNLATSRENVETGIRAIIQNINK